MGNIYAVGQLIATRDGISTRLFFILFFYPRNRDFFSSTGRHRTLVHRNTREQNIESLPKECKAWYAREIHMVV